MNDDEFGAVETQGCLTLLLTLIGVRWFLKQGKNAEQADAEVRKRDFRTRIALMNASRSAERWNRLTEEHEVDE